MHCEVETAENIKTGEKVSLRPFILHAPYAALRTAASANCSINRDLVRVRRALFLQHPHTDALFWRNGPCPNAVRSPMPAS